MKRLERKLDEGINQTQAGFRQNRGTRDQIFNLRMLIEKCRGANGKEVKELRYADDTVLFAQTPEGLLRLLQSVKTHSESSGLYLNANKTKIMDLDKSPTTTIYVDGEQLENVNNFVYLGSRIDAGLPSLFLN